MKVITKKYSCVLDPVAHIYQIEKMKKNPISSTRFVAPWTSEFNAKKVLQGLKDTAIKENNYFLKRYLNPVFEVETEYTWATSGPWGTKIHDLLELVITGKLTEKEFTEALAFDKDIIIPQQVIDGSHLLYGLIQKGWRLFGAELELGAVFNKKGEIVPREEIKDYKESELFTIAGALDIVLIKDGKLAVLDWKTAKKIEETTLKKDRKKFKAPFADIEETKKNKYAVQLAIGRLLLTVNFPDFEVLDKSVLVYIPPENKPKSQPEPCLINLNDAMPAVKEMLKIYLKKIK